MTYEYSVRAAGQGVEQITFAQALEIARCADADLAEAENRERANDARIEALEAECARLRLSLFNAAADIRWKLAHRIDGMLTASQIQDIAVVAARIEKELETQNDPT